MKWRGVAADASGSGALPRAVPRPALAAIALFAMLGAGVAVATQAHGSPTSPASENPPDAAGVPVAEDYVLNCSACHGPEGAGTPGVTPTLVGVGRLLQLQGGRSYLARVPGVAQAPLSDARLARLLNWVLERYSGAPPDPPYTAAEISELRAAPLRDTRSARQALGNAPVQRGPMRSGIDSRPK